MADQTSRGKALYHNEDQEEHAYLLDSDERAWLDAMLKVLEEMGIRGNLDQLQELFDQQKAIWAANSDSTVRLEERADASTLINMLGAGIGDLLEKELGLEWVIWEDQQGADIALYDPDLETAIYPMNFVARRWTGETKANLKEGYALVIQQMRDLRAGKLDEGQK